MNCLQFFIFTRFFAVHFFYNNHRCCCELLTIFYLYKVLCSWTDFVQQRGRVVNCLQFFIFTRFFAVEVVSTVPENALWIAYNFLSLQGSLQCRMLSPICKVCCELLTIFYLYKVLCSSWCIQNWTDPLWIAYNFLSLQGSLQ